MIKPGDVIRLAKCDTSKIMYILKYSSDLRGCLFSFTCYHEDIHQGCVIMAEL